MSGAAGAALQVTIGLATALALLPYILLPRLPQGPPLTALWRLLTAGAAIWLALGLLLALLSSIELATIGLALTLMIVAARYLHRRRLSQPQLQAARDERTASALDAMDPDTEHSFLSLTRDALARWARALRLAGLRLRRPENLVVLVVLVIVVWREFPAALGQVVPATPDGYEQLLAAKQIALNMGIYTTGAYPLGVPILAALLSTSFFFDPLNVLRFLGPLLALLQPLAAAALAAEIAESTWAAAVALTLVALTALPALGGGSLDAWYPLSAHAALVFLLAQGAFLVRSLRRGIPQDAWLACTAGFVAVLFEPLAWPYAALLAVGLGLPWIGRRRAGVRAALLALLGATVGFAPFAAALLTGHAPAATLLSSPAVSSSAVPGWLTGTGGLVVLAGSGLLMLLTALRAWRYDDGPLFLGFGICMVAFAAEALLPIPPPLSVTLGVGGYVGFLAVPVLVGWLFSFAANQPQESRAAQGLAILLGAGALASGLMPVQATTRYEVPGSGVVTGRIETAYEAYQWTAISPTEQYSELLGKGWHVELRSFLRTVPLADAKNPRMLPRNWPLQILSPDTFLYVPRITTDGLRPARADLAKSVPDSLAAAENLGPDGRVADAHAYAWAMAFLSAHPQSASVFFRGPDLLVLRIHQ